VISPYAHRALFFADMVRQVHRDMPEWKRIEVRQRLLNDDIVTPIEIELGAALRYQSAGCQVTWVKPRDEPTFDLLVRSGSFEFELECKGQDNRCWTDDRSQLFLSVL
jgi:hypothetical protein